MYMYPQMLSVNESDSMYQPFLLRKLTIHNFYVSTYLGRHRRLPVVLVISLINNGRTFEPSFKQQVQSLNGVDIIAKNPGHASTEDLEHKVW